MKVNSLIKKSIKIEDVYSSIETANEYSSFKHFIPTNIYVSDDVKLKLMADGFKVYVGDWDGVMTNVLIIEW